MDRLWTPWRYAYVTGADRAAARPGVPQELAAWPGDLHCVFCNLVAAADYAKAHGMEDAEADRAAGILERGRHSFLVLNSYPYNSGHIMAVPYAHQASLVQLEQPAALELMLQARRAEAVLRSTYQPHGLNFGINLGAAAGAGVAEHLHLHAVPRWEGDTNFMSVLAETRILPEPLGETWRRLRLALAALPLESAE